MKRKRYQVSLIERASAIFVIGLVFAASSGLVVEAITTRHFVQLVLSLGLGCLTVFLLCLAITYRNLTDEQVKEFQQRTLELPGQAPIAPDSPNWIISVHGSMAFGRQKWRIVAVDLTEERIHFKNCFVPNRLMGGWASSSYASCSLHEVLSIPYMPNFEGPGGDMHIITKSGKAILPDDATNYVQLRELLKEVSQHTPLAAPVDSPYLYYWIIAGTLVGIFCIGSIPLGFNRDNGILELSLGGLVGGLSALCIAWIWGRSRRKCSRYR
jgi:hypothetical protein